MVGTGKTVLREVQVNVPAKNNGTSTLDIVIESAVAISITIQVVECLFAVEVFKLDNHVGVHFLHRFHKLVHELLLNFYGGTLLSKTQVHGILQVGLIVGTAIQDDGQSLGGMDARGSSVQGQLANLCW